VKVPPPTVPAPSSPTLMGFMFFMEEHRAKDDGRFFRPSLPASRLSPFL
jgi:hypothetical protein